MLRGHRSSSKHKSTFRTLSGRGESAREPSPFMFPGEKGQLEQRSAARYASARNGGCPLGSSRSRRPLSAFRSACRRCGAGARGRDLAYVRHGRELRIDLTKDFEPWVFQETKRHVIQPETAQSLTSGSRSSCSISSPGARERGAESFGGPPARSQPTSALADPRARFARSSMHPEYTGSTD